MGTGLCVMIVMLAQQSHTRLGNVSTGGYISALREPAMTSKYDSKELIPVLVRRILGNGLCVLQVSSLCTTQ